MMQAGQVIRGCMLVASLALSACGGGGGEAGSGSSSSPAPAPVLESLTLTPDSPSLGVGSTLQLTATGHYSNGTTQDLSSAVVWSSGDAAIVTVDGSGLAQGVAVGDAAITATSGVISTSKDVSVLPVAWSLTGSLNVARARYGAVLLPSGKVLVVGGYQGTGASSTAISSAELYDPVAGTWSLAASMPTACAGAPTVLLPNGRVMVICLTAARIYDPAANTWAATASPTSWHISGAAIVLGNGKVLAIGGDSNNKAELYDPVTDTWSPAGTLPGQLRNFAATLLADGKVLVTGGYVHGGTYNLPQSQAGAQLYDPATNMWTAAASMGTARSSHTTTLLANGKVLVSGGLILGDGAAPNTQYISRLASAELYDPVTNSWTSTGAMSVSRYGHASVRMPNGDVLAIEGSSASTITSAERYDPDAGTWSAAGNLSRTRTQLFSAVVLQDGAVLVIGGTDGGEPFATTELLR